MSWDYLWIQREQINKDKSKLFKIANRAGSTISSLKEGCQLTGIWVLTISLLCAPISCERLPPIYWNATNVEFHQYPVHPEHNHPNTALHSHHHKHLTIDVKIRDLVDIMCPFYENPNDTDAKMLGYLEIHQVSKHAFETCAKSEGSKIVGVCGSPDNPQIVSLSIRRFTPKPGGLEFTPGFAYYFITTSNGTIDGMKNSEGGLCASHNMKLQLNIFSSQYRHHKNQHHHTRPKVKHRNNIIPPSSALITAQSRSEASRQPVITVNSPHQPKTKDFLSRNYPNRREGSTEIESNPYNRLETLPSNRYPNQRFDNQDSQANNHERSQASPRTGLSPKFTAGLSSDPRSYPLIYLLGRQAMSNKLHNHTHAAYIVAEEYWPPNSSSPLPTLLPFWLLTICAMFVQLNFY